MMEQPLDDEGHAQLRECFQGFVDERDARRQHRIHLVLNGRQIVSAPPSLPPGVIELSMEFNRLTSVPSDLLSRLDYLSVTGNQLSVLPNCLPTSPLRHLIAAGNRLATIPEHLPPNLETLELRRNHIVDLSPEAIDRLARLPQDCTVELDYNPLSPQTIERLRQLQNSPGYRGPLINFDVIGLSLEGHDLNSVPHHRLPADLEFLDISNNPLTDSINNLPRQLRTLFVERTGLTSLPADLPLTLEYLNASDNQLVDISQDTIDRLVSMSPVGIIDLRNNPLSPETIDSIDQHLNSPTYQGPRIYIRNIDHLESRWVRPQEPVVQPDPPAAGHAPGPADNDEEDVTQAILSQLDPAIAAGLLALQRNAVEAGHPISDLQLINMALDQQQMLQQLNPDQAGERPALRQGVPLTGLAGAVSAWRRPGAHSVLAPTPERWQDFSTEPNAGAFSTFLTRLGTTVNANNPAFRHSVSEWLRHLETHPQLRSDTFAVSQGASASCGDRIYHAFNDMRQLRLASDVAHGTYDQRLPELLNVARDMFRLGQLEIIAREHTASLAHVPGIDEIEVYLGFQVKLRESLALPLDTANMHYPTLANITSRDLERAFNRVIEAEEEGFADYLANDWRPWQAVLQRLVPEQYEQAQAKLIDAMDEEFTKRLNERLKKDNLENDLDAKRTVGPVVLAEIAREINRPLTHDFLRDHGLDRELGCHLD